MIAEPLEIPEVLLVKPRVFRDLRGHFLETWHDERYGELGIGPFVQDNVSVSRRGALRGLHFQNPQPQGKLISVLRGQAFDVAVDIRRGSPTYRRWVSAVLSEENGWQLFVPPGFAHGFQALTEDVVLTYKCTEHYASAHERTVRWNDPEIGIHWPLNPPLLKERDANAPALAALEQSLPRYEGA